MGVIGAYPGDLTSCLFGSDSDACRRVYFGYYLWPHLQKMLEQIELLRTPPIPFPPLPGPDPPPWLLQELVSVLLARFMGDPRPQPSIPRELRLETTIKFRDGLQALVRELDAEVKNLEKGTRSPARRP